MSRRLRSARLLVAAAALALPLTLGVPPSGAGTTAALAPARSSDGPVAVVIDELTPSNPRPGQKLRISGRVVNTATDPVRQAGIRLLANPRPVGSRNQLAAAANIEAGLTSAGGPVAGSARKVPGTLRRGESAPFEISVPLDDLGFPSFGVYVIGLEVTGLTSAGFGTVGSATTFLPWTPQGTQVEPTRLAVLWPLVARPQRDADGIFRDDTFGDQLAVGGRLRTLVDSNAGTPLTWMVDPQLLESVADMANGYEVHAPDGKTVPGTRQADAQAWLANARERLASSDVVSLPYADPDLVALRRRGLQEDLTLAATTGPATASKVLGRDVRGDVVWPPDGRVDQPTLDALRLAGVRSVVLDGAARPVTQDLTFTPTGRTKVTTIGGSMSAAIADPTLSKLLAAPTTDPGTEVLARQRFLAETAMITAERPGQSRAVLALPPRAWDPAAGYASSLLGALRAAPWVTPVTLDDLLREPVPDVSRAALQYGKDQRRAELPAQHLLEVAAMRRDLERFASILAPRGGESTAPFDLAILRTESSAWRTHRREGRALLREVRADLDARRAKVYIAADRLVTLTSKSGRFPITIANDLDQPVDLRLELNPRLPTRLSVGEPDIPRIGPRRKTTIEVPAEARANGVVVVDAQLRTPEGIPYGEPVSIAVRATDYGTIAYVITAGALVVLFVAAGFRLTRRALRARRRPPPTQEAPVTSPETAVTSPETE